MSTTMRIRDVASVERLAEPASSDRLWLLNLDVIEKDTGRIREKVYVESGRLCGSIVPFSKASVLYSKLRPNLNKVVLPDEDGFATTELLPLKVNSSFIRREYLAVYLRSQRFVSYAVNAVAGAKMPRISRTAVLDAPIPIPDLAMQDEIVSELNAVCGNLQSLTDLSDVLDELVKSRFVEMFGNPETNPMGWQTHSIGELATDVRYGTSKPASADGEYTYIRMNNMTYAGGLDLLDTKRITLDGKELDKALVRYGDLLFNRTNSRDKVGKTCVFKLDEPMVIAGYIIRVRLCDDIEAEYLSTYLNTNHAKRMLKEMAHGAVNQANINAKEMQSIIVPVPPIELQREFLAFVQQVDKLKFD